MQYATAGKNGQYVSSHQRQREERNGQHIEQWQFVRRTADIFAEGCSEFRRDKDAHAKEGRCANPLHQKED